MQTITFASGKGGSGRSTTALALAVHAFREGHKTAVVDLDPGQGVLQRWAALREKPGPVVVIPDKLLADLKRLAADGTDYVFIDTEPAVDADRTVEAAIAFCNLVLVPVRPSFFDVTSIGAVTEMCRERDKAFRIVLVDVDDRQAWKRLNNSAAKVLTQQGKVLESRLTHQLAYVNAHARGLTGGEINAEAKAETAALWDEVKGMLDILLRGARRGGR